MMITTTSAFGAVRESAKVCAKRAQRQAACWYPNLFTQMLFASLANQKKVGFARRTPA
jgi:hypothetical protein